MNTIILILLFTTVRSQNPIQGPVTLPIAGTAFNTMISKDARIVAVTFYLSADVEVYENTGSGFQFKQSLPSTINTIGVVIGSSGKMILIDNYPNVEVYTMSSGGTFTLSQTITPVAAGYCWTVQISEDEKCFYLGLQYGHVEIYEKSGTYALVQTLTEGLGGGIEVISVTDDGKYLMSGSFSQNVYLYEKIGSSWTHFQTISLSFKPDTGKIGDGFFLVTGNSNQILIYENNGSNTYFLSQTILTNETKIYEMGALDNLEKIFYGGTNQTAILLT